MVELRYCKISYLGICFQFSCVGNTSFVTGVGEAMMNKVEFVGGAENWTQAVKTVSFGYGVG